MPEDSILKRHVGDLGNIQTDVNGTVYVDFADPIISLIENNTRNIIDLTLMVHNLTDDGGHTGKEKVILMGKHFYLSIYFINKLIKFVEILVHL